MSVSESRLLIVCYHYIRERNQYKYPGIHPVEMGEFHRQVRHLKDNFHMATPEELEGFAREGQRLSRSSVFLTFDDGLADHLVAAEHVLDPLNVKGAFFIPTKPLAENKMLMVHKIHWLRATTPPHLFRERFEMILYTRQPGLKLDADLSDTPKKTYPFDTEEDARLKYFINYILPAHLVDEICDEMLRERDISEKDLCSSTYMNEEGIRYLSVKGHIIGSHGHTHTPFSRLDGKGLSEELKNNLSCLEKVIKTKVTWVSYPYGMRWSVPQIPDRAWEDLGLRIGLSLDKEDKGWNNGTESPFWLKRINCNLLELFTGKVDHTKIP